MRLNVSRASAEERINDLYTANVVLNGVRRPTAFLLKGNGLKKREMNIGDCGKNGDQIVRLFESQRSCSSFSTLARSPNR